MPDPNVIYEVNVEVATARAAEYDQWLDEHVTEMLALPGFIDAQTFASSLDDDTVLRSVHYRLTDEAALNSYFDLHAERMRAPGVERFGDDISASRRILNAAGVASSSECLNCHAPMQGQYCGECGQRHRTRMISVFELLRDVFEDVLSWDSRIWRSLRPLLFRPGKLTAEYLAGRRTYYTPPLRMYLALSVIFFLMTALTGFGDIDLDDIEIDGIEDAVVAETGDATLTAGLPAAVEPPAPGVVDETGGEDDTEEEGSDNNCDDIEIGIGIPGVPDHQLRQRLVLTCERVMTAEGRRRFVDDFADLIPTLLIIMLPLIALASRAYSLFSRRYYVEHLLFYTHYHSFVFLFLLVLTALFAAIRLLSGDEVSGWLTAGAWIYGIYYLFRSMRVVFGHGRVLTVIKLVAIGVTYFIGGLVVSLLGVLFTALSA